MNYITSCVHASAHKIDAMKDKAIEITYNTFRRRVGSVIVAEIEQSFGYDKHLRLKDDWAIRFYRSKWNGKPCYVMRHSAIEYIYQ